MVYGGGGVFGIAYGAGVAVGLREAGIPVGRAPALGTSAGSWVASVMVRSPSGDGIRRGHSNKCSPPVGTPIAGSVPKPPRRGYAVSGANPLRNVFSVTVRGSRNCNK